MVPQRIPARAKQNRTLIHLYVGAITAFDQMGAGVDYKNISYLCLLPINRLSVVKAVETVNWFAARPLSKSMISKISTALERNWEVRIKVWHYFTWSFKISGDKSFPFLLQELTGYQSCCAPDHMASLARITDQSIVRFWNLLPTVKTSRLLTKKERLTCHQLGSSRLTIWRMSPFLKAIPASRQGIRLSLAGL